MKGSERGRRRTPQSNRIDIGDISGGEKKNVGVLSPDSCMSIVSLL